MTIKDIDIIRDGGTISIRLIDNTELFIPTILSGNKGLFKDYQFKVRITDKNELKEFSAALADYLNQLRSANGKYYQFYRIGYIQGYLDCIKVNENENRSNRNL